MTKSSRPNQKLRRQGIKNQILRALRPWHRRLGLLSALFILLLALTGVAINHSQDFNLDTAQVKQGWLLDYYGITAPKTVTVFHTEPKLLAAADNQLWLEDKLIIETEKPIIGASYFQDSILAIDTEHLYLFSAEGDVYETQGISTGLPANLLALGKTAEGIWLNTRQGPLMSDAQLLDWQAIAAPESLIWLAPIAIGQLNQETLNQVSLNARSGHLTWERVMLDLHSGRLFGALTIWLWDLFALALLLVASSGVWIWMKQR
jgi:hypothetical protein